MNLQDDDIHIWLGSDTGKPTEDLLRDVLGRYLDCPAQQMRFVRTANGKPYLLDQGPNPLQFNVSHSQGRIACAVSRGICLGLDSELQQAGVSMIIYSTPCLFAAQAAIDSALADLQANEGKLASDSITVSDCNKQLKANLARRDQS